MTVSLAYAETLLARLERAEGNGATMHRVRSAEQGLLAAIENVQRLQSAEDRRLLDFVVRRAEQVLLDAARGVTQ